jgi:hypothetical protein
MLTYSTASRSSVIATHSFLSIFYRASSSSFMATWNLSYGKETTVLRCISSAMGSWKLECVRHLTVQVLSRVIFPCTYHFETCHLGVSSLWHVHTVACCFLAVPAIRSMMLPKTPAHLEQYQCEKSKISHVHSLHMCAMHSLRGFHWWPVERWRLYGLDHSLACCMTRDVWWLRLWATNNCHL